MSRSQDHFKAFKPHSLHKHLILRHYFSAWGPKLGLRRGAGDTVLYVDACAGPGQDDEGNQGSPLIAASAAEEAQANVGRIRGRPFRILILAVEAREGHFRALRDALEEFGPGPRALHGTLETHMDAIETEFPNTPTLYFIDPFGLAPLRADVVRRALSGAHHEALLLFADQDALRQYGALASTETRSERRLRGATDSLSQQPALFPELDQATDRTLSELTEKAELSRETLHITKTNAERILHTAFGDLAWLPIIQGTPQPLRRQRFLGLYEDRLRDWGATRILRIPIVDADSVRAYTLMHASRSPKAFATMKEAVHHALRNSPLPADVVDRMQAEMRCDVDQVARTVVTQFAGQQVRWAEDAVDKNRAHVKRFLMEDTTACPFDFFDIKARLQRYQLPARALTYRFPPSLQTTVQPTTEEAQDVDQN